MNFACYWGVRRDADHLLAQRREQEQACSVQGSAGVSGLRFTGVSVESNAPPYSPRRDQTVVGDNIGLFIEDARTGQKLFYAPGLGGLTERIRDYMAKSDCLLYAAELLRKE